MFEPATERVWPKGPNYLQLLPDGTSGVRCRVNFKLVAAEWYLETLRQFSDLDRFVGVEMAIDGLLGSVSSAFDGSVAGIIIACEEHSHPMARLADNLYSWGRARALLKTLAPGATSINLVDSALEGANDSTPKGWLAVARRLRNRSVHHSTLARHFSRHVTEHLPSGTSTGSAAPTELIIAGAPVEPIGYFADLLGRTRDLTAVMLGDADSVWM